MKLPVLPLREAIVFADSTEDVYVGREKSVNAIHYAHAHHTEILIVSQKTQDDHPTADNIYTTATLAKINSVKSEGGGIKVSITGLKTVKIKGVIDYNPTTNFDSQYGTSKAIFAEYDSYKSQADSSSEGKALVKSLKSEYDRYSNIFPPVNFQVILDIKAESNLNKITNMVLASLNIKLHTKHEALIIEDVKERASYVLGLLKAEIEIDATQKRMEKNISADIQKAQKEYFLRDTKKQIEKELGEDSEENEMEELKTKLDKTPLSTEAKSKCDKEYKRLKQLQPMSADAGVIRNYLDNILGLPWGKYSSDTYDVKNAKAVLDADHYGLEKVKERILEQIAVMNMTKGKKGTVICLAGPPGTGKTTISKSIAKSLNREFIKISLGGVKDESEIRGHRRTYVGAMPGKIISAFKKSSSMNPVILLDEIDKMSSDYKGDPSSAMLEVLDPSQNSQFNDHYLDLDFDLSKVLFIATANYVENIPRPLLDRMELIRLDSYIEAEKIAIAKDYLIKKCKEDTGLTEKSIVFSDEAIVEVVRSYTREAGVRNLERKINKIFRKLAVKYSGGAKGGTIVTVKMVNEILGPDKVEIGVIEKKPEVGLVNGMAYSEAGGDLLQVECTKTFGKGNLVLTGQLGDVMKESANIAFTYVKSIIPAALLEGSDVHVHFPDGSTPKDGPSAGIALVTSIISCLTNTTVKNTVSMTGEVTIRGKVLPIGGVKEKVISAHRGGVREVILPMANKKNVKDVPEAVAKDIKFYFVEDVREVLKIALTKLPKELK